MKIWISREKALRKSTEAKIYAWFVKPKRYTEKRKRKNSTKVREEVFWKSPDIGTKIKDRDSVAFMTEFDDTEQCERTLGVTIEGLKPGQSRSIII